MESRHLAGSNRKCRLVTAHACDELHNELHCKFTDIQTGLYFVYIVANLHVYTVCIYCDCFFAFDKVLLKNFTTTTTTT